MHKKLLILDLDETLIYAIEMPLEREEDFRVGQYYVYKRPFVNEFLSYCFENFEVAVWTSSTNKYATEIVAKIFPTDQFLSFLWSRERCTLSYEEEEREHFFEKKMHKIRKRGYDLKQVIVVDDSPEKWRTSYGNLVRVKPFFGDLEDNELEQLSIYLKKLETVENVRKVEKRNWHKRI